MTARPAALPLFGDAYMADTRHLTLEEHGAYLMLLLIAWRSPDCSLPDDDARLARMLGITPKKWAKLKPSVMAFWKLTATGWQQERLTKEFRFVAKKSEQNRQSANSRWNDKSLKNNEVDDANAHADAMPDGCPSTSTSTSHEEEEEEERAGAKPDSVEEVARLIGNAGGINHNPANDSGRYADNLAHVREWMKLGATVEEMTECARRVCASNSEPIRTFRYLDPAIRQTVARRENPHGTRQSPVRSSTRSSASGRLLAAIAAEEAERPH
ncbi:DUF1376 domain-containing protein [Sphingobium sp. LMC3-1-1.1]|uniref:YdaU family protein n=1 Tax=Sphingobium sp. LMC3-1-1.1 TaxID=3135241 RepID=UPI003415D85A